jgi:hypothetical protein
MNPVSLKQYLYDEFLFTNSLWKGVHCPELSFCIVPQKIRLHCFESSLRLMMTHKLNNFMLIRSDQTLQNQIEILLRLEQVGCHPI